MKVLLDTHAFLWLVSGDDRLGRKASQAFLNKQNEIFLSIVSIWEITIKTSLGKLKLKHRWMDTIRQQLRDNSIQLMPLEIDHCEILSHLPYHHRDRFDRMLIAQASFTKMPVVSRDHRFSEYGVKVIW